MRGYSELEVFGPEALQAFRAAEDLVERFPERDERGELLRCHEISRVVARVIRLGFDIEVVDGRYETGAEHSWCCITKQIGKYARKAILDPYVVGRLPPVQLVACVLTLPCRYEPGPARQDIREDVVEWLIRHYT